MTGMIETWIKNDRQERLFQKAVTIADEAKKHIQETDQQAAFSSQTLKVIKEEGYPSLALPPKDGGEGLSLYELLLLQEKIAEGDGAVALSIGWHMGTMMELSQERLWGACVLQQARSGSRVQSEGCQPGSDRAGNRQSYTWRNPRNDRGEERGPICPERPEVLYFDG